MGREARFSLDCFNEVMRGPGINDCKTTEDFNCYLTVPGKKNTYKREVYIFLQYFGNFEVLQL